GADIYGHRRLRSQGGAQVLGEDGSQVGWRCTAGIPVHPPGTQQEDRAAKQADAGGLEILQAIRNGRQPTVYSRGFATTVRQFDTSGVSYLNSQRVTASYGL